MLLTLAIGVFAGRGYNFTQVHGGEYKATAKLGINHSVCESQVISVTIDSKSNPTVEAAAAGIASRVALIADYTKLPVSVRRGDIRRTPAGSPWWKSIILSSTIATLLAVGVIYIFEDTRVSEASPTDWSSQMKFDKVSWAFASFMLLVVVPTVSVLLGVGLVRYGVISAAHWFKSLLLGYGVVATAAFRKPSIAGR